MGPKSCLLPGPKDEPTWTDTPGYKEPREQGGEGRGAGQLTLITEGPLPGSPLETLNNAVLHRAEKSLVHLQRMGGPLSSDPRPQPVYREEEVSTLVKGSFSSPEDTQYFQEKKNTLEFLPLKS